MSRWSDQFDAHAIHQTLQQARDWLDVEVEEIDSEHEIERRRLIKSLELAKKIVAGIDPEFFPEPQLTQLNNHLNQQNFLNQLQSYSSNQDIQYLRIANDQLTTGIPIIYQLSTLSSQPETKEAISAVENAYDTFCLAIEKWKADFEERLTNNDEIFTALDQQARDLNDALKSLNSNTGTTLSGWQSEFTDAQTARAEEYSNALIGRSEKFDAAMREWRTKSEEEIKDISTKHSEKLQGTFNKYTKDVGDHIEDMENKHAAILEIHGLVGTDGVAGGYQSVANDEQKAARRWRFIAMVSFGLAAAWIVTRYFSGFDVTPSGGVNWAELITAASLTLVLLGTGSYSARQSKIHRETEQHMKWFALEVKAIDPFLSSLPEEKQNELKEQLSQKLFGQNRITADENSGNVDPIALKTISDIILNVAKNIPRH